MDQKQATTATRQLSVVKQVSACIEAMEARERLNEQASALGRKSKADATKRAYECDLRDFAGFCQQHDEEMLPASPQTVARYVAHLSGFDAENPDEKKPHLVLTARGEYVEFGPSSVATINRRMVAIAQAHKDALLSNPVADPIVRKVLQGLRRNNGVAQTKKTALTADLLKEALATIDAGGTTPTIKGLRDRAMLLLTWFTACRRSEIAALNVEDLIFERDGLKVTIRRSKTDQTGEGRKISLPVIQDAALDPKRAVADWLEAAGLKRTKEAAKGIALFRSVDRHGNVGGRIIPQDVARLVQRVTTAARIDGDFAAHSTRSGWITTAAMTSGVTEQQIQHVSGHKSVAILRGYVQHVNDFTESPSSKMFGAS
jgi:integrase